MTLAASPELLVDERPRRHGAWVRRCPHCRSSALVTIPRGCLECAVCKAVLMPPSTRSQAPSHATAQVHPCWEDDHRLQDGTWDAYSREGSLVAEWGRSTTRADGQAPPLDAEEVAHMAPRVLSPALRGRQDDVLDREVRAYVDETEALGDAVKALRALALTAAGSKPVPVVRRPRVRLRELRRLEKLDPIGAAALGEESRRPALTPSEVHDRNVRQAMALHGRALLDEDGNVVDEQAHLFKSLQEHGGISIALPAGAEVGLLELPHPVPRWHAPLGDAVRMAMLSQLAALAILLTNALKRRGVPVADSLDLVSPKTRRTTPFAGYNHAIAAAFGVDEPGEGSPIPKNALATHTLPQGVVFGQIACKPSRTYPASAKEISLDDEDVWKGIEAARVGARTYSDAEYEDPETHERPGVRREAGRPLLAWEIEALRLLDAGEERAAAHRTKRSKKIDALAVERLTYEDALPKLKRFDGAPKTVHELKLGAKAARKAVRLALEDLGLVPSAAGAVREAHAEDGAPMPKPKSPAKKRAQTSPFAAHTDAREAA